MEDLQIYTGIAWIGLAKLYLKLAMQAKLKTCRAELVSICG